jgi:hypothetical protein
MHMVLNQIKEDLISTELHCTNNVIPLDGARGPLAIITCNSRSENVSKSVKFTVLCRLAQIIKD